MNKGKSAVHQKCSSLFLYFQLGLHAIRLVSSNNWRYKHPFWGPKVAPMRHSPSPKCTKIWSPTWHAPQEHTCDGFSPLQPTRWATHLLWASFSQGTGHSPLSFMTTGTFSCTPDMDHSPLSFVTTGASSQTKDCWSWGSQGHLPTEGCMLWCATTEARCLP